MNVFTGVGRMLLHQRDDDRRIDAARKKRAQRHIAPHPHLHGRIEQLAQFLDRRAFRQVAARCEKSGRQYGRTSSLSS